MVYNDESLMPFGKFQGNKLANVPAVYLLWLYTNVKTLEPGLKEYIKDNEQVLKKEVSNGK